MRIALRITIDVDPQEWADEYGIERDEVRADVRRYVQTALSSMPVEPDAVTINMTSDDVATCPLCKQPVHWDTEHYPHAWRHEHVSRWCLAEPGKHPVYPTGATDRAAR